MILVTGATGLVGAHLLGHLLQEDVKIRALYRNKTKIAESKKIIATYFTEEKRPDYTKIEWVETDITNIPALQDAFKDIKIVYHCAGFISYDVRDYKKLRKINIEGTANMVNIALANSVKKFCHVSSISALGEEIGKKKITEESPRNNEKPHSNYSISKYGAEMEVWRASQEGLPVIIVNPGLIIGNGFWQSGSGRLFERINKGLSYYLPLTTGFVAVEDVVKAMIQLTNSTIKNESYILVGENLSFKQVLDQVAENLNKPKPKKALKPWMVFIAWLTQSIGNSLFNTKQEITYQSIKGFSNQSFFDNQKIKNAIKLEFTPISKSIEATAKAYRKSSN